jgi:hypothetical protein
VDSYEGCGQVRWIKPRNAILAETSMQRTVVLQPDEDLCVRILVQQRNKPAFIENLLWITTQRLLLLEPRGLFGGAILEIPRVAMTGIDYVEESRSAIATLLGFQSNRWVTLRFNDRGSIKTLQIRPFLLLELPPEATRALAEIIEAFMNGSLSEMFAESRLSRKP